MTPGHNDTLLQIVDCRIWVSNSYAICSKAKQQSSKALQLQKLITEINQKRRWKWCLSPSRTYLNWSLIFHNFSLQNKLCVIQPQSPKALRLRKLITEITQKKTVKTDTTITHILRSSVHTNSFWQHFPFKNFKNISHQFTSFSYT